ncbi:MAG: zinc ribbon domain-containing protein [Vicinamibacterales bacterium]
MLADLERLVRLQRLDDFVNEARRILTEHPERIKALDERLTGARGKLARVCEAVAGNQAARRSLEKDLAAVQGRLTRFKDQLMEVKTNREYQAMLTEIENAQREVREVEDRILERMLEADELAAAVKVAEAELRSEEKAVAEERAAMEQKARQIEAELERSVPARQAIIAELPAAAVTLYDQVARSRKGTAVAEARDGHCTVCHVRLRPQRFNDVRRNDAIVQCDSCQRILFYASGATANGTPAP